MIQRRPETMKMLLLLALWNSSCGLLHGQQSIGTVGVQDATISGSMEVTSGRAVLVGNTSLMAKDHTAEISLVRGGTVRVCATSGLHIAAGQSTTAVPPLMLALDRGAVEVNMAATTGDAVITPDLRFTMRANGPLDLHLRVTRDGDTCVENRGAKAPVLNVADQFGEATYQIHPGQHVMFEHGSLKEVVDNESSSCGCPPEPVVSIADAAIGGSAPIKPEPNPFPQAVSQGLAPAPPVPQAPAGQVHTQVATTLSYSADDSSKASAATPPATQAPPSAPPPSNNVFHKVGHFFKRIFGGG